MNENKKQTIDMQVDYHFNNSVLGGRLETKEIKSPSLTSSLSIARYIWSNIN